MHEALGSIPSKGRMGEAEGRKKGGREVHALICAQGHLSTSSAIEVSLAGHSILVHVLFSQ
jgi:hypothetical protein